MVYWHTIHSVMPKSPHDTTNLKTWAQVCKLEPSPLTYTKIFCVNENLLIICFSFRAMVVPFISWASNRPNNDVFRLLVGREKIHYHDENVMAPFWHPKVKSACGNQAFYQGGLQIFCQGRLLTNARKMSSMKTLWLGSSPLGTTKEPIFATK